MILSSLRVVTPKGIGPAAIHVRDGRIESIVPDEVAGGEDGEHFGDLVLLPGLVDTHVHVNEPGRTEWEGFATAGDAAAAGGITTLVDMPLNSHPCTVDAPALNGKREDASSGCRADFAFWGGLTPDSLPDLAPLADAGARGFKAFLCPSGLEEFPPCDEATLRTAMTWLATRGLPMLVHAEDAGVLAAADDTDSREHPASFTRWAATRSVEAETAAVDRMIRLARETGAHVHVVHVSAGETVRRIAAAREAGVRVTAETCPHYLTFTADDVGDGDTRFKCAPPLRGEDDRHALWEGLRVGGLDLVASDHSPCPASMKPAGDFPGAWGGIASLQIGLPAVWSGARRHGLDLVDVARWMSERPAALAGLERKGALEPGKDADLVLFDPDESFVVSGRDLHHRHPETAWEGRRLTGVVRKTWQRGELVYADGEFVGPRRGREAR